MAWKLHAIEQTQLRRQHRVDGVGRPKFDIHTGTTKPLGDSSNKDVQDTLSKHREDMIRRYAGERDDLMAALGAALTNLHSIGASYPRWVWERYEKGRTSAAAWTYTGKSGV